MKSKAFTYAPLVCESDEVICPSCKKAISTRPDRGGEDRYFTVHRKNGKQCPFSNKLATT